MFRAQRALPLNIAKEILLTGEPISADRAYSLGLVNVLTEPGATLEAAVKLARPIVANGPVAMREILSVTSDLIAPEDVRAWELTEQAMAVIWHSADAVEGRNAFLEKRPPVWRGR